MASVPVSTTTVSTPAIEHPLRNPKYRLWLVGGTISFLGDQFYMVALPWLILQKTGSAVAMGAVMMAGSIPRALLMLMGGVLSDRMSARKIMMTTATARTICVAVIGILIWFGILHMWELYVLAVFFGVADAFAAPASSAYLPSLLQPEQLVAASSVSQSTMQLTTHCWPGSGRICDQGAGGSVGLLRGCNQFPVYHRRTLEAARSASVSGSQKSGMALRLQKALPMWEEMCPCVR